MKISFGANSYETKERLKARLESILDDYERKYTIERKSDDSAERFNNIITSAYEQTGKQVVILIDEYVAGFFCPVRYFRNRIADLF